MKPLQFLIILFPFWSSGQKCDSVYISLEENMMMGVDIEYQNCHYLYFDTTFNAIVDGREVFVDGFCRTYLDPFNNKVRLKLFTEGDTSYTQTFSSSGKLRTVSKTVQAKAPDYHNYNRTWTYYENGQVKSVSGFETGRVVKREGYYENGTPKIIGKDFHMSPYGTMTSYHLNGNVAAVFDYQLPDTTNLNYQAWRILNKQVYDEFGNAIDTAILKDIPCYFPEEKLYIYPPRAPWNDGDFLISEGLYVYDQFEDQIAYADGMKELKRQILKRFKTKSDCDCDAGVAWISLFVSPDGKIKLDKVEFTNPRMIKSIEKAIKKIKKWPPGMVNGKPVEAYIYTYLPFNL